MARTDLYPGEYFKASTEPVQVSLPSLRYLSVTGSGSPECSDFRAATRALYTVANSINAARKKSGRGQFTVGSLEGLWWVDGDDHLYALRSDRSSWRWRLLIAVPKDVKATELKAAVGALGAKDKLPACNKLELFDYREGNAIQVMHVGPHTREEQTLSRMDAYMREHGLQMAGAHHEIYLSDPGQVPPEELRIIVRHPVLSE